jgi:hypothetical protein
LIGASLFLPMASRVVGQEIALTPADTAAGTLPDQIKAAAQRQNVNLPEGWKAEVARQFALEWSRNDAVAADLVERAERLFKEINLRFSEMAAPPTAARRTPSARG